VTPANQLEIIWRRDMPFEHVERLKRRDGDLVALSAVRLADGLHVVYVREVAGAATSDIGEKVATVISVTTEVFLRRENAEFGPNVRFVLNALVRVELDGDPTIVRLDAMSSDTAEIEKLEEADLKLAQQAVINAVRNRTQTGGSTHAAL
jgi:hypothetical protein